MPDDTNPQGASPAPPTTILGGDLAAPAAPAFTPSYEGALNADGTFVEGWHAKALGTDYNGPLAQTKSIADVDKMLRDNIAAARAKTDGMVKIPGADAKPEERAAFLKAIGAPDSPEAYGELRPETVPPAMWDGESEKALKSVAHKHGLTSAAMKDIIGLYAGQIETQMGRMGADSQAYVAGQRAELRQEWGDKFEPNVRQVTRLAATVGLDAKDPIFANAKVVKAFAQMAGMLSEDKLINGATVGLAAGPKEQATAIMTDKKNPHYEAYQRGDPNAVALVNSLLQQK